MSSGATVPGVVGGGFEGGETTVPSTSRRKVSHGPSAARFALTARLPPSSATRKLPLLAIRPICSPAEIAPLPPLALTRVKVSQGPGLVLLALTPVPPPSVACR